jgi:hypothetical protein
LPPFDAFQALVNNFSELASVRRGGRHQGNHRKYHTQEEVRFHNVKLLLLSENSK